MKTLAPEDRKSKVDLQEVASIMKAKMEERKVSVRKLASQTGISPAIIQDLRSGKKNNITLVNLVSLFDALNLSLFMRSGKNQIRIGGQDG